MDGKATCVRSYGEMTCDEPAIFEGDLPVAEDFDSFHPFIKGVFSQWHPTPLQIDGLTLVTAEQWMMCSKARLFSDDDAASAILATTSPDEQKRIGQTVRGFQQETWDRWKVSFVKRRPKLTPYRRPILTPLASVPGLAARRVAIS